jgi:hypothetical protein
MLFKIVIIISTLLNPIVLNDRVDILNSSIILKSPQKLSDCKAKLDDGSIVDLSSLNKPNSPRFYFLNQLV